MFRLQLMQNLAHTRKLAILAPMNLLMLTGGCPTPTIEPTELGVNVAPTAEAGPNITAAVGQLVELDGGASADQDGDPLSYSWVQTAGPSVSMSGRASRSLRFSVPESGTYEFALTVSDGNGGSDVDSVSVTVENNATQSIDGSPVPPQDASVPPTNTPVPPNVGDADNPPVDSPNARPVANAGPDQQLVLPSTSQSIVVLLDGSGSPDPDGDPLEFTWLQTGGSLVPGGVAFTAQTSVILSRVGVYEFTLQCVDNHGARAVDTVTITLRQQLSQCQVALNARDSSPWRQGPANSLNGS